MELVITNWLLLDGVFFLALISPGPDFVVAIRNSVLYSRWTGIFTAIGFGLGVAVHCTYVLFGIAALIAQSVLLFNIIKYVGAAYLFYVGFKALKSQGSSPDMIKGLKKGQAHDDLSMLSALWSGFLTNVLNPKATMFFMAVFAQFIDVNTSMGTQVLYAGTCVMMTILWFSAVSLFLTLSPVKRVFFAISKWIDRVCGCLLIGLGVKLALTKSQA